MKKKNMSSVVKALLTLRGAGIESLTEVSVLALANSTKDDLTPVTVSESLDLPISTISRTMLGLAAKGLLQVGPDEYDRRRRIYTLTAAGLKYAEMLR